MQQWAAPLSWLVCVYVYKHASVPTCLAKETERLSNLDPCKDEKETWERGREGKVECGGKREITRRRGEGGQRQRKRGKGEHTEDRRNGTRSSVEESAPTSSRLRPKIEPFFFFCFPSSSSAPLLSEKRERFLRGKFTAGHRAGRGSGSSPEMNRGGSFRRRLSSLRGAWRWSTGYLFRKVGCDEWRIWLKAALVASSLSTLNVFFFFVIEKVFVSFADFYKPPTSFPSLPPFLPYCLTLSQMVNLYGLLVKSTSPDVFHLETGPGGPPTLIPTSSSSFSLPTTLLLPPPPWWKFPKEMGCGLCRV